MADPKPKEPWPVSHVKFRDGGAVINPNQGSTVMEMRSHPTQLSIVFDLADRMVVITCLRPDGKPHPERAPVLVPLDNVAFMR